MADSFILLPDGTKLRDFTGVVGANNVSWEAQSFVDPTTGNAIRIATTGGAYRLGVESLIRAAAKGTTAEANITSTSIDADHQALDVSIKTGPKTVALTYNGSGDIETSTTTIAGATQKTVDTFYYTLGVLTSIVTTVVDV